MARRRKYYLIFLFDLEVKGQGPTKVIMVHDTPPYGHAPKYQISLTYLERQKCSGPKRKYYLKNNYLTLTYNVSIYCCSQFFSSASASSASSQRSLSGP
jgi:hypothetical protein